MYEKLKDPVSKSDIQLFLERKPEPYEYLDIHIQYPYEDLNIYTLQNKQNNIPCCVVELFTLISLTYISAF